MSTRIVLGAVVGTVAVLVAAAGALGWTAAPAPQRVTVGMTEFKFAVAPKTVTRGAVVTFALTNKGNDRTRLQHPRQEVAGPRRREEAGR